MEFLQSTLEEIIESERLMLLTAEDRYGKYYRNARVCSIFLSRCIAWWGGSKRKGREETPQAWKVTTDEVKARGYNLDIKNPHTVADDHGDPEELLATLNAAEAENKRLRDQIKAVLAEALAR